MADDGDEERVTAHSYGKIDTSHVSDECWVIRIPQKLAELWEKAPEGTNLGELIFTKGGTTKEGGKTNTVKPSLTVHASEELVQHQDADNKKPPAHVPFNYSLQAMTKKIPNMHPFTRNPKNGSVKLLGTVTRTANMQVEQQDTNYRAMLKDRLVATSITTTRYVKPVETTESVMTKQSSSSAAAAAAVGATSNQKGFGNAVFQYGKRMLEAAQDRSLTQQQAPSKKARKFSPDQPMRSVIFELFGQQQYWTVKDLKAAAVAGGATAAGTKRAETEIRDILREIGDYHRSGDHKNMWELRKEFQQQS